MKVIQSEGGPLIGLEQDLMHHWNGVGGKSFVGSASPFISDYEAICHYLDISGKCSIAKFPGSPGTGLLMTMPLQTAVIENDRISGYIAQVHYADEDWCFSRVTKTDFEKAEFKENIPFSSRGGKFVFFDAAYPAEHVGDDYIFCEFSRGTYILSAALYYPDSRTHCILYKIERS